jgi:sulfite exporter TauE/SafE
MSRIRWAEAVSGIIATLLAVSFIAYLLFGSVYTFANSDGINGTANILQAVQWAHIQPITIVAFSLFLLSIIGVGMGAVGHSRTQKRVWQKILFFSVSIMVIFTLLALLSIGPLIAPTTLIALLTLFLSFRVEKEAMISKI